MLLFLSFGKKKNNLRRTEFLDAQFGEPLAHVDAFGQGFAGDKTGLEATSEGVTRLYVSIEDFFFFFFFERVSSYPAPLVSLIFSFPIACTGKLWTSTSPLLSFTTAAIVGSVPCVITTVRVLLVFFLGSFAISFAISAMSFVS